MKYPILILFIYFLSVNICKGQVPVIGDSSTLEIANWNLEWFGKTGYGPSDERLQQANIRDVVQKSDIDIWTFCEVSNNTAFDSLMTQLPQYGYTVCNYSPEQKTAVIFNKNQFELISSVLIGNENPDSFTTRRFPYLVKLKPLAPIGIDTLCLIALHLKANYGTNAERLSAYNSRLRSGEWLKMYLSKIKANNYYMVLGDWNDDLDESIFNGLPSPFANMLDAGFSYEFITKKFTDNHTGTTTGYPDAIDHQLISKSLKNYLSPNSTAIFYLNKYISNYSSTTSDHYPVYSIFSHRSNFILKQSATNHFFAYPNPTDNYFELAIKNQTNHCIVRVLDMNGKCLIDKNYISTDKIDTSQLPAGCYQVIVMADDTVYTQTIQIMH